MSQAKLAIVTANRDVIKNWGFQSASMTRHCSFASILQPEYRTMRKAFVTDCAVKLRGKDDKGQ